MSEPVILLEDTDIKCTELVERAASLDELSNQTYDVQDEIKWGLAYRTRKYGERKRPIPPKKSPINIPFRLCRENQTKSAAGKSFSAWQSMSKPVGASGDKSKTKTRKSVSKKSTKSEQMSLLDRSTLSQKEYMELLSKPNPSFFINPCRTTKKKKRTCCKCELEPCPPRIVEMSVPQKRLVIENWRMYEHTLSTERILHLNEMLHTNKNLDPKDARYYFKQLDRLKRKEKRRKLKEKRKKKLKRLRGDREWLKNEVSETARAIVEYIQNEPLLSLNYKQMMMSECLLENLESNKVLKKPKRTSTDSYKQTVVEISDKVSVWMDSLVKFVDMYAVQSEERVAMPSLISMLGEEEEEGYSDWGSSDFSDEGSEGAAGKGEGEGEGEGVDQGLLDILAGEYGEGEDLDYLNELSEDQLQRLIKILSNASDEFLSGQADPQRMGGVTYADILEKLRMLRDGLTPEAADKPLLEQIMIDWARRNEPDQVDQKLLNKIEETAAVLQQWLLAQGELGFGGDDGARGTGAAGPGSYDDGMGGGLPPLIEEEPTTSDPDATASDFDKLEGDAVRNLEDEFDRYGGVGEDGIDITQEFAMKYTELITPPAGDLDGEVGGDDQADEGAVGGGDSSEGKGGRESGEGALSGAGEGGSSGEGGATGDEGGATTGTEGAEGGGTGLGKGDELGEGAAGGGEGGVAGAGGAALAMGVVGADGVGMEGADGAGGKEGAKGSGILGGLLGRDIPGMLKGHKPSVVFEHAPDTVCCLSLKIWAVWLLEITHNAHQWTQWISNVIQKVREFAATVRGDVLQPDGEKKVLYKQEWRHFARETEEMSVSWRQYSKHVRDLTNKIVENFHGKHVNCCPKCMEDHLIKNVTTAHETLQALTDAISCAGYWQRCLDEILEQTMRLTGIEVDAVAVAGQEAAAGEATSLQSGGSLVEIQELFQSQVCTARRPGAQQKTGERSPSEDSIYEIEECDSKEFKR